MLSLTLQVVLDQRIPGNWLIEIKSMLISSLAAREIVRATCFVGGNQESWTNFEP